MWKQLIIEGSIIFTIPTNPEAPRVACDLVKVWLYRLGPTIIIVVTREINIALLSLLGNKPYRL